MDNETTESPGINHTFLKSVRIMGLIEGISTLVLFGVAMPLKYMANMPKAVTIAGNLHGVLFVCLVIMLMMSVNRIPISKRMALVGIAAAVIPFGPFIYDRWLVQKMK